MPRPGMPGLLIGAAMGAYAVAFLLRPFRARLAARIAFAGGFVLAAAAFGWRWWQVGVVPLQNLFGVFLSLGVLVFPLCVFCERFLAVRRSAADPLLGLLVLVPPGLFLESTPQLLPPALQHWLFIPHVAAYMLAYVILFKACVEAVRVLLPLGPRRAGTRDARDEPMYRLVRLALPLLTAGLILGACWGKLAWGDYWNWDPKELWSLATWLLFVAYLHVRVLAGSRRRRVSAATVLAGGVAIIITLLWVNLASRFLGLHSYAT